MGLTNKPHLIESKGSLQEGIDYTIKSWDNGTFAIIHHTDASLKNTNRGINNMLKSMGLDKQGFLLLPE